jgi:hypothetical protein
MGDFFDFNDADEQKSFDLIPDNTIATVQLTIRPGGAGKDGWLKRSKDGASEGLDCMFTVVDGPYAKRKFFGRYTVEGTTQGHKDAKKMSRDTFRAMLESARGIRFDDESDAAIIARQTKGWADFDQLRFVVCVGVRPPQNGYEAQNAIKEIITPKRQAWKKPEQIDRSKLAHTAAQSPTQPAADAIARPDWAR